jgi:hypothetical protein
MAQELFWLDSHVGSLEDGVELINELGWYISTKQHDGKWFVFSGDQKIFSTDSYESVQAFLYGMSLAYSIMSEPIIQALRKDAGIDEDE